MKRFWLILAASLGLGATALPASADVTYTLNCNANPCTTTGNYGSVTLHQTSSTTVTVTVDLTTATPANVNETFAGSGAGYTIAWNVLGNPSLTSVTVTSVSPGLDTANFVPQQYDTSAGSGYTRYKASPFTSGNCTATSPSCFMYAIDTLIKGQNTNDDKLVFDVTKSGGLAISDFLTATSNGYLFAVDIFRQGATFNVAAKIPEPATWLMFFAGLAGLTFMMRRRRKLVRAA